MGRIRQQTEVQRPPSTPLRQPLGRMRRTRMVSRLGLLLVLTLTLQGHPDTDPLSEHLIDQLAGDVEYDGAPQEPEGLTSSPGIKTRCRPAYANY